MKKIILPKIYPSLIKSNAVISSYICLKRNIDALLFPEHLVEEEKILIENQIIAILKELYADNITVISVQEHLEQIKSDLLLSHIEHIRNVIAKNDGSWVLVLNDQNHISLFASAYGLSLKELYKNLSPILIDLDSHIHFAYTPEFGFTTADIQFAGNGLLCSILLNLTGLELKGLIESLNKTCSETGYILIPYTQHPNSGLFLLQNIGSFGISESAHIEHINQLIQKILASETQAQKEILDDEENKELFIAQIHQLLKQQSLSYPEATHLISLVDFLDKKLYVIQNRQLWLEQIFRLKNNIETSDRAIFLRSLFSQIISFK
ncbi:MAG: hypothetical protein ACRC0X_04020 [Brevinema sp.]